MSNRLIISLLTLIALFSGSVSAGSVESAISSLLKDMSVQYLKQNPDPSFKATVGILKVANESPLARKHGVGEAIQNIAENQLQKSLVFDIVDRQNVDKIVKQLEFGMTGLVETSKIQAGKIKEIEYFVDGSVTEMGSEFKILFRLIKVETAEIVFTGERSLQKSDIIQASEDYSMAFVAKHGIGVEISLSPFFTYLLDKPMFERQSPNEFVVLQATLNYRTSRNFVIWGGVEIDGGMPNLRPGGNNVALSEIKNFDIPANWTNASLGYSRERKVTAPVFGMAYVLPINTRFNISLGSSIKLPFFNVDQKYYFQHMNKPSDTTIQISAWNVEVILEPKLKFQYFLSPRSAIHLSYAYSYQFSLGRNWEYLVNSVLYRNSGDGASGIPEFYNIKPWLDIRGNPVVNDLSGHRIEVGIGLYF